MRYLEAFNEFRGILKSVCVTLDILRQHDIRSDRAPPLLDFLWHLPPGRGTCIAFHNPVIDSTNGCSETKLN